MPTSVIIHHHHHHQVAAFQCLQPFVGTALAIVILGEEPTWWDLGAVGVIIGLGLVTSDTTDMQLYLQPMVSKVRRILSTGSFASLTADAHTK